MKLVVDGIKFPLRIPYLPLVTSLSDHIRYLFTKDGTNHLKLGYFRELRLLGITPFDDHGDFTRQWVSFYLTTIEYSIRKGKCNMEHYYEVKKDKNIDNHFSCKLNNQSWRELGDES